MPSQISTKYDKHLACEVVQFPSYVTETQIRDWIPKFLGSLAQNELVVSDLLLDTNWHDFENTNCLKLLRETLTGNPVVRHSLARVAFVQPLSVRGPSLVSKTETYFCEFDDALAALQASSLSDYSLNGS